jgi:hypothetical protein
MQVYDTNIHQFVGSIKRLYAMQVYDTNIHQFVGSIKRQLDKGCT